jgi:hypothetical protein
MDAQRLVDFITELVVRELQSAAEIPTGEVRVQGVLVVCGNGERNMEELPAQLRDIEAITVIPSAAWPRERIAALLGSRTGLTIATQPPPDWAAAIRDCQAVLLPNPTWHDFVALALLSGHESGVAAALQALIENRPVVAVASDVNFLLRHAAHLQKPFLGVLRSHVSTVQSFGVHCVEMASVGAELKPGSRLATTQRGRDVLTRDDVDGMLASGAKRIEVAHGTIVTALAREVADRAGVPIEFR